MSRSTRSDARAGTAGFTLIEVVVALAVIAVVLVSIGSLVGAAVRGSHALDEHIALDETVRGLAAELADRNALQIGSTSGATTGIGWRIDIAPYANPAAGAKSVWEPVTETITVQGPFGKTVSVTTLRLRRRPPQ